jgi:hypothetical protein
MRNATAAFLLLLCSSGVNPSSESCSRAISTGASPRCKTIGFDGAFWNANPQGDSEREIVAFPGNTGCGS